MTTDLVPALTQELARQGYAPGSLLRIPIEKASAGPVRALGEEVPVVVQGAGPPKEVGLVKLPPVSKLWRGSRQPPSMSGEPPAEYQPFFLLLELTAAEFCAVQGKAERDAEFERLYRHLRRRPDGTDANPLFSYLQAAARLYLALHEVSKAEFEAVASRLERSARTFYAHEASTNYADRALRPLLG